MNITEAESALPADLMADTQAILAHLAGAPLDPEVARRIRERGERIREGVFRKHGLLDIGVPAIRECKRGTFSNPMKLIRIETCSPSNAGQP